MLESSSERLLKSLVKNEGGKCYKWTSPGTKGVPDRIILWPGGRVSFVEMKTHKGRLEPMQIYIHSEMGELGHHVDTLYGPEQVRNWVARESRRQCELAYTESKEQGKTL